MRRLLALAVFGGLVVVFPVLPAYAALADADGDLILDELDLCPAIADPFQGDVDSDGVGDLCDSATAGVASFEGTPLSDLVIGTDGNDTLAGADGNDALYGEGGDDVLNGGNGLDFLSGGPGTDTLTGGAGCDVFAFDPNGDGDVITDFNPDLDRLAFPAQDEDPSDDPPPEATFGGDDYLVVTFLADNQEVGTLEFQGLEPGIEIALLTEPCEPLPQFEEVLPPNPPPDTTPDLSPPDVFSCSPLFDEPVLGEGDVIFGINFPFDGVFINGTAENETLSGTPCSDLISGDSGIFVPTNEEPPLDFILCATSTCSDDVIHGFAGNDLIFGDSLLLTDTDLGGNDQIFGGSGDDLIVGDAAAIDGIDSCECEEEEVGNGPVGGDDVIFGEDGNDFLIGDAVDGLFGNAKGGNDTLEGGGGNDTIFGDAVFEVGFGAAAGDDILIGAYGNDIIFGDAGFFIDAFASGGDDVLVGGAGDDILYGDADFVDGVAGSDTFLYDTSSDFGDDVIVDVAYAVQTDTISFTGPGLATVADLDARSTVTDDGFDVQAVVFTDPTKSTEVGSILIIGVGSGGVAAWADIDGLLELEVVIFP